MSKKTFKRRFGRTQMRSINWQQQAADTFQKLRKNLTNRRKRRFIFIRNVLVKSMFKDGIDNLNKIREKEYKLMSTVTPGLAGPDDLNFSVAIDKRGKIVDTKWKQKFTKKYLGETNDIKKLVEELREALGGIIEESKYNGLGHFTEDFNPSIEVLKLFIPAYAACDEIMEGNPSEEMPNYYLEIKFVLENTEKLEKAAQEHLTIWNQQLESYKELVWN